MCKSPVSTVAVSSMRNMTYQPRLEKENFIPAHCFKQENAWAIRKISTQNEHFTLNRCVTSLVIIKIHENWCRVVCRIISQPTLSNRLHERHIIVRYGMSQKHSRRIFVLKLIFCSFDFSRDQTAQK